jgi:flavodoxin/NAD-dependent dihydropyrimidine dehydrogenase PreA subunit
VPRAAVIYFSPSGITAKVADAIAAGLRSIGYVVELWNLKDRPPLDIGVYDLLGLGSNVYYYRLPFNVTDYLQALPSLKGMPAFCFLVHGSHAFDAVNSLRRILAERGAKHVGYFHCSRDARFLGNLSEGYLSFPEHPSEEELEQATVFGVTVAQRAAEGVYAKVKDEPNLPLIYRVQRGLMSRRLPKQVYSRLFKVDPTKCTACGLCMEICPTKNIETRRLGQPLWGRNCLYRLSCETKCREDAISSAMISRPILRTPFLALPAL